MWLHRQPYFHFNFIRAIVACNELFLMVIYANAAQLDNNSNDYYYVCGVVCVCVRVCMLCTIFGELWACATTLKAVRSEIPSQRRREMTLKIREIKKSHCTRREHKNEWKLQSPTLFVHEKKSFIFRSGCATKCANGALNSRIFSSPK